tara:strand:+ start:858 stop:1064 length:207 start_codon:yes stop_codon:yes gene_type:complete
MVTRSRGKPKKTWAKAKAQSIRVVGKCRYCGKEMTNDESFVCFADKTCGHYQCMKADDEKENKSKFDW